MKGTTVQIALGVAGIGLAIYFFLKRKSNISVSAPAAAPGSPIYSPTGSAAASFEGFQQAAGGKGITINQFAPAAGGAGGGGGGNILGGLGALLGAIGKGLGKLFSGSSTPDKTKTDFSTISTPPGTGGNLDEYTGGFKAGLPDSMFPELASSNDGSLPFMGPINADSFGGSNDPLTGNDWNYFQTSNAFSPADPTLTTPYDLNTIPEAPVNFNYEAMNMGQYNEFTGVSDYMVGQGTDYLSPGVGLHGLGAEYGFNQDEFNVLAEQTAANNLEQTNFLSQFGATAPGYAYYDTATGPTLLDNPSAQLLGYKPHGG